MNRREFLGTVAAAAVVPARVFQNPPNEWGAPVFDLHFHMRPQPASNLAHLGELKRGLRRAWGLILRGNRSQGMSPQYIVGNAVWSQERMQCAR